MQGGLKPSLRFRELSCLTHAHRLESHTSRGGVCWNLSQLKSKDEEKCVSLFHWLSYLFIFFAAYTTVKPWPEIMIDQPCLILLHSNAQHYLFCLLLALDYVQHRPGKSCCERIDKCIIIKLWF